jgi:sulfite exporter TauE/SafE
MLVVWLAFLAGITGSFHCIGMCGGVVAALSLRDSGAPLAARICSQLCYNLGRVATYTLLGAVAGLAGSSLDLVKLKSASFWFLAGANLLVVMLGLSSALGLEALNLSSFERGAARFLSGPVKRALSTHAPLASLPLGLVLGLLPCGMVYAPLVAAAGTGSAFTGAATMAALGAGTVPVMLGLGTASSAISGKLHRVMLRVAGVAVALMGVAGLWRTVGG